MNKLEKELKEIVTSGYDHTQIMIKVKGLKEHHHAVVQVPKFMYPNQIKREFPTAVEWGYYGVKWLFNKKGECKGSKLKYHGFIGSFE